MDTHCSICRHLVMDDDGPIGDIVDKFVYDFDGSLDYIELMHRKCALRKGYKLKGDTVISEAMCTGCMGTGVYKHEGDARKYECPYCGGNGKSPYPVKSVKEAFKYSVERVKGTLDYRIVDTDTRKPVGGTYKVRDYDDDDIGSLKAANSRCAQMNRDWADKNESFQTFTTPQVDEALPEPLEDEVRRVGGRFQVVDKKGKPVGGSHPSYSAAQKASTSPPKRRLQYDSFDAAPAISKNECSTTKYFGKSRVEMAPPGKRKKRA